MVPSVEVVCPLGRGRLEIFKRGNQMTETEMANMIRRMMLSLKVERQAVALLSDKDLIKFTTELVVAAREGEIT